MSSTLKARIAKVRASPEYAKEIIEILSGEIIALETKVKAQAELLERAKDYLDAVPCSCNGSSAWNQLPAGHVCASCLLLSDLEKLQSEEAGEKE